MLEILQLWESQYQAELSNSGALPDTWSSRISEVEAFLRQQLDSEYFAVAKSGGNVIGYMLFQVFSFHGESTAFCPIIGHAEKGTRRDVSERLYQHLSERLVAKGILSHTITYFAHNRDFEETIFALGFGMIVIDVFRDISHIQPHDIGAEIVRATQDNVYDVKALAEESRGYYLRAPIFLTRSSESLDYYQKLLGNKDIAIYLAFVEEEPVGFMSIRRNRELRLLDLCDTETALIDEIGAYIEPVHRGKGIGTVLLSKCVEWCQLNKIAWIHVDFESANLLARPFWLKFFKETIRSTRRTVYRDVRV